MAGVIGHTTDKSDDTEADESGKDFRIGGDLRSRNYTNWVKAAEGLVFLQQGLAPFVDREISNKHALFLNKVPCCVQGTSGCRCTFNNILPDHDIRMCSLQKCLCKEKNRRRRKCPNNYCSTFCQLILNEHKTDDPLWKNTDINAWPTDHWSIAKCYMTTPTPSNSAQTTDASGLLSVIINGKFFQSKIASHLGQPGDVFLKAREMRNDILHRAKMELTDAELQDMLDTCIAVLKDPVSLLQDRDACLAVQQLESLKNDQLQVTTEEETKILYLRTEALKQTIQEINEIRTEALESIDARKSVVIDDLNRLEEETVKRVQEAGSRAVQNNAETFQTQIDEIRDRLRDTEEKIQACKCAETNVGESIPDTKEVMLKQLPDIRRKLADHLSKHYTKTSVSPLKTRENDVNIDDVYTEADMKIEKKTIQHDKQKGKNRVKLEQYTDIFETNGTRLKRIYVLGEVGTGKTTFCQMLINKWCNFIIEDSKDNSELMQTIKKFDFVFYLPLKCLTPSGNLKGMIKWYYENEVGDKMLDYILSELPEKCLILADGLDEWKPSSEVIYPDHITYGIPYAEDMKDVTLLTTSRPSALGVLNMKLTEYDNKIILSGITKKAVHTMTQKYCAKLKADSAGVLKRLTDLQIRDIESIPLILKQIVWMFGNGYEIAPGVSGLYSDLVKIAMKWAYDKYRSEINYSLEAGGRFTDLRLPEQLNSAPFIEECQDLVLSLSQIAFDMLTSDSNQIFGRLKLGKNGIKVAQIKALLAVGLLSENNFYNPMEENTQFSFPHTSFVEYFTAVFITSHNQTSATGAEYHPDSKSLLNRLFEKCRSTEDVLPMKVMLKFICGLAPYLTHCVCQNIYKISQSCNSLFQKRESMDHRLVRILAVQRLIAECVSECNMGNSSVTLHVPVFDLIVNDNSYLYIQRHIEAQCVQNLIVEHAYGLADQHSAVPVDCSQYKHLKTVTILGGRTQCLVKKIDISKLERFAMTSGFILGVLRGKPFRHLQEIELDEIELKSHSGITDLLNVISCTTTLRMIHVRLKNVLFGKCCSTCHHVMNLSGHDKLQTLRVLASFSIYIAGMNTSNLREAEFDSNSFMNVGKLRNSQNLKYLTFTQVISDKPTAVYAFGEEFEESFETDVVYYSFTEDMNKDICTCTQLQRLTFRKCNIMNNALQLHSCMKNLSHITLSDVKMSESTLIKFVESLLTLGQSVNVEVRLVLIYDNRDLLNLREKLGNFRDLSEVQYPDVGITRAYCIPFGAFADYHERLSVSFKTLK